MGRFWDWLFSKEDIEDKEIEEEPEQEEDDEETTSDVISEPEQRQPDIQPVDENVEYRCYWERGTLKKVCTPI